MGPRPHLLFFVFKAASLAPELQVSIGPSPHLWFLHAKHDFGSELQISMCTRPHLRFFALKTASLAPELQVSMGPSSHLWFCVFTTSSL